MHVSIAVGDTYTCNYITMMKANAACCLEANRNKVACVNVATVAAQYKRTQVYSSCKQLSCGNEIKFYIHTISEGKS